MAINLQGNAESTYSSDISAVDGTFSGNVDIGSGNIELNADGSAVFTGVIKSSDNGGDYSTDGGVVGIAYDGNATFQQVSTGTKNFLQFYKGAATNGGTQVAHIGHDGGATFKGSLESNNGVTVRHEGINVGWYGVDTNTYNKFIVVCRGKDGTGSMNGPYVNKGGNSWTTGSDLRMKEGLVKIDGGLEKVSRINAYIGNYKEDTQKHSFLVAQELQQVLPEAVDVPEDESQMMGIRYDEVIPLLVSALHDAKDRIEALEAEVQALKGGNQ